jgi:hypothetical protein
MQHWKKFWLIHFVLPVAVSVFLHGCANDRPCDVVSERDVTSPDGRYIASIFETTCYDTTGYTPHAQVGRAGEKRADRGNLLTGAPTDTFRAGWTSRDNLLVEYQTYQDYMHRRQQTSVV